MPRLILTRHAKSDWGDPLQDDFDRVLNPRGRAAASALGRWMAAAGYVPDQVICSSARRTRETWAHIADAGGFAPEVRYERALYHASQDVLLAHLRRATGACVLMIAHNPGIAAFAEELARAVPQHPDFLRYPTGATCVFDFAGDWSEAHWAMGTVVEFVTPRSLG